MKREKIMESPVWNISADEVSVLSKLMQFAEEAKTAEKIINGFKFGKRNKFLLSEDGGETQSLELLKSGNVIWHITFVDAKEFTITFKREEIFSWFKLVWAYQSEFISFEPNKQEEEELMRIAQTAVQRFRGFVGLSPI